MSLSKWKKRASHTTTLHRVLGGVQAHPGFWMVVGFISCLFIIVHAPYPKSTPTPTPACPDLEEIREEILGRSSDWCWGVSWTYLDACRGFRDDDLAVLRDKYTDAMACHKKCPTLTSCDNF